jgi:hypothetical protein
MIMTDGRRASDGVLRLRNLAMIENIRGAEAPGAAGPCRRAQGRVAPHGEGHPAGGVEHSGDRIVKLARWPAGCTCPAPEFEHGLMPGADRNRAL